MREYFRSLTNILNLHARPRFRLPKKPLQGIVYYVLYVENGSLPNNTSLFRDIDLTLCYASTQRTQVIDIEQDQLKKEGKERRVLSGNQSRLCRIPKFYQDNEL